MAKFSIKESVAYGFHAYAQHFLLLIMVGLTVGAVQWGITGLPSLVAEQLGIKVQDVSRMNPKYMGPKAAMHHNALRPRVEPAHATKTTAIHHHLKEAGKKINYVVIEKAHGYMDNDPTSLAILFAVFLAVLVLYIFVQLGAIRIALDIVDKNVSSYQRLFSQKALFFQFIGLWIVYALLMMMIAFGVVIAGVVVGGIIGVLLSFIVGEVGVAVGASIGAVGGFVILFKFMIRYVFAFYCLVDKKMGIHKALSCTYSITQGSVLRLIVLLAVITLPITFFAGGTVHLHAKIGSMVASDTYSVGIIGKLVLGLLSMWYALCFAQVYRKLSRG